MSKTVNWNSNYTPIKQKVAGKYNSYAEFIAKAKAVADDQKNAEDNLNKLLPALIKNLNMHIQRGLTIEVAAPFAYMTEVVVKGSTKANFVSGQEVCYAGSKLVIKGFEKTLNQMIFEDQTGKEVPIYIGTHTVGADGIPVRNEGYIGLLTRTNIYSEVKTLLDASDTINERE